MIDNIYWLGHASFKIKGEKVVYIDPWKLESGEPADIILVTHSHYDHCSPEDIKKIASDKTWIVTTPDSATKLTGNIKTVRPGDNLEIQGIKIEVVPAYNVNKNFHPRSSNWVGFVFTLDNYRIYFPGDCDYMDEMRGIQADIVLIPIGGTYTMSAEEAAQAVNDIGATIAIPMHYGDIVGSQEDAERFKNLCRAQVIIKSSVK